MVMKQEEERSHYAMPCTQLTTVPQALIKQHEAAQLIQHMPQ